MTRYALLLSLFWASAALGAPLIPEGAPADPAACGPFPKFYKETIYNWMKDALVDADSAKIEWGEEPKPLDMGKNGAHLFGWLVRFKVNARNRLGGYTGKQAHAALLRDNKVIQTFGFGY